MGHLQEEIAKAVSSRSDEEKQELRLRKARIRRQAYNRRNKEEIKKKRRAYYQRNREEMVQKARDKRKNTHPDMKRNASYMRSFGITLEQVDAMEKAQDGKCAICRGAPKGKTESTKRLYVDHCHSTKKIRSLLCHECNIAIGKFKENIEVMERAAQYLEHHETLHKEGKPRIISNTQLG